MKARSLSTAVALGLLVASTGASALAPTEATALVPFNFSNPGARSLGMGGAFLGASDDATAALVNPAGLTRLGLEQQFSVEYRNYNREVPYAQEGFITTNPYDNSNVLYRDSSADDDEISYLSWVLPRDNWAFALYRHQMVNFNGGHSSSAIPFQGDPQGTFIRAVTSRTDLEVVTYGASFAWNATETISVGAGINWNDFEMTSSLDRFDTDGSLRVAQRQRGDDDDIGYNVGLLFRGSDNVSFGISYRSAPEFRYAYTSDFIDFDGTTIRTADATTPFKSPDVFGIGVSWRATDALVINLDVNRVGYSNITEDIDDPFFTTPDTVQFSDPQLLRSIRIKDSIEPRLGVEYAFATANPTFIRGGIWREKRHTLEFDADPEGLNFSSPNEALAFATLFAAGDDETHVSLGFGMLFESMQIDFAYDRSDRLDTLSVSGVYRF
ncbi:OmpP1/FadL family transporter [Pseudomarimonas salicorniae]|uniref:Outer membrane protein transport protein n=1 Tax=Pseudomarimonas salicorniae TaxID=2933270 RepID=A0ABT0GCA8_9GAMM|nr:outer membrane protein transport protein [Lysobacter sp. CAU 1642]MCK7592160.1 outer membrane protein transport protein [Lysobacter sp. CAU 1642]